jgi:hypothetical protein
MAISNNNTGLRPGVCTSSTRPTSPYNGQVIYETDTKQTLVYQGSSWVMLTDADTPPGLELIKTQTVGSGVTSANLTNVFSSNYDSYRITWNDGVSNGLGDMRLKLGSTTTGYAYNLIYTIYGSTTVQCVTSTNDSSWKYIGGVSSDSVAVSFDLHNPYKTYKTFVSGSYMGVTTGNGAGQFIGFLNNTTSYTDFTLYVDSPSTLTGGTIRVYGYRNSI